MSSDSLVSTIIIFLNAESFIEEAVESVLGQTYRHWELLLVDDGSTDASTEIARHYAVQKPGHVRYLEHPGHKNRGMSASRNLGIRHARGEYVALLDADDVWLPRKLERQVALLESHPQAGMLYGNTQYWYSWTGNPEDKQRDHVPKIGIQANALVMPPTLLRLYLEGKASVPCTCSIIVRRRAVERVGGFEESFRGQYEDQAFYAKICLREPIFVTDECLDRYRQHPDSDCCVVENAGQTHAARLTFLNWLEMYLNQESIQNPEILDALRRAHWRIRHPILARMERSSRRFVKSVAR
jgi:glycosyltransferase involved in cell wall biosynthesis